MKALRELGWITLGASFGAIAGLLLVAGMGLGFGVGEALYLFSRHSLSRKAIGFAIEGEWFWLGNFVIYLGWPAVGLGALLGPPAIDFLTWFVRHLYRISGTNQFSK